MSFPDVYGALTGILSPGSSSRFLRILSRHKVTAPSQNRTGLNNERILLALFCCALAAVPFLVVKFPPLTDLPQHVAQVRLFGEALSHPDSPYRIQWTTPYSLVYAVLGGSWLVFGAEDAGRIGMLFVTLLWVVMLHLLAARTKRPALAAVLASLLFFGHILYWGFCQFAFGWPLFIGFLLLLQVDFRSRWKDVLAFATALAALYFAHIFWLLAAVGWLGWKHIISKRELKRFILRAAAIIPLFILAASWYPTLKAYGFRSSTIWATMPWERLSPHRLVDAAFGGLRGSSEPIFLGLIVIWLLLSWLQNRKGMLSKVNKELLLLATAFFILALVLPEKYTNTIRFWERWVPPALVFLLLGLPEVRYRKSVLTVAVCAVVVFFFALTSINWIAFESSELAGLQDSLSALPRAPRVVGLSYLKDSAIVRGRPFIQMFAYCQVYQGGELNFSFADFGPSLVIYRQPRRPPWTLGLEWFPEKAKNSDLAYFDYALISGDDEIQTAAGADSILQQITLQGRWRLYKIREAGL
jgi:hypothetical protein